MPHAVFISYSHDSKDHADRVFALAARFRAAGIDAWIDQFEPYPKQGWPRWMEEEASGARFVLIVATPRYRERFEEPDATGGVTWESVLTRNLLYATGARNTEERAFVPVWFSEADRAGVPLALNHLPGHLLAGEGELLRLERRLLGEREVVVPPLGVRSTASSAPLSPDRLRQDPVGARKAVRELLMTCFNAEELRMFLRDLGRDDIISVVYWRAALAPLADEVVEKLWALGGVSELLDGIVEVRPRRARDILAVKGKL